MDTVHRPVRILLAEDVPTDAEMVKREINKVLPGSVFKVVETREDFKNAILEFIPDLVLSDYRMPTFDGMSALKIALRMLPDTPVIIVTGSINEETAVECMKAGAVDYVLKESLKRLGQAVLNALEQKEIKLKKTEAENRLAESEERFRRLAENAQDLIYQFQLVPERKFNYVSPAAFEITGYTPEEHYDDPDLGYKLVHPDDRYLLENTLLDIQEIRKSKVFRWIKKDGKVIWTEQRNIPIYDEAGNLISIEGIARDITESKLAMEALRQSEKDYRRLINGMNDTVWILDLEKGKILDVNKSATAKLGYSREELFEMGLAGIDKQLTEQEIINSVIAIKVDRFHVFETKHGTKNGKIIPVEISSSLIKYRGKEVILSVARDITDRLKMEEELRLVNRAIEQSPVSIIITDKDGRIDYVNSAFTKITGYQSEEVKGKNPNILKSGKQPQSVYQNLWDTILSGNVWFGELMNKRKNGNLYWADVSISPVTNSKGEVTHFVSVREDISEKKKMIEDLMAAKEKAEESDRLKSAFLANMSHEIRTPMNGILGFANLLKEPLISDEEKENFIGIIEKSGERMLATLNDLIDISKIESGIVEIELSDVDVKHELKQLYNFFEPEAKGKGLSLIYSNIDDSEVFVMETDRLKFLAIITNLIKNAVKYTGHGLVEFGYKSENNKILFFVKDTGIGIETEKKEAIFERFVQADSSISRNYEGSGLGLSISKAYVQMLGGNIWVESVKGEGSVFYFNLPFVKQVFHSSDVTVNNNNMEPGILNKITVLLAEDDEIGNLYLSTLLGKKCKKIYFATNGQETVDICNKNPEIDLVLMDIRMPVMDGYIATRKLRETNSEIIIFAQTAYAMAGDREKAINAGCNEYLTKPIDRQLLFEYIDKYFKGKM